MYVAGEAPSFVSSISDMEVELDSPIKLLCQVRGTPKKITWMKDGEEIEGDRFKYVFIHVFYMYVTV